MTNNVRVVSQSIVKSTVNFKTAYGNYTNQTHGKGLSYRSRRKSLTISTSTREPGIRDPARNLIVYSSFMISQNHEQNIQPGLSGSSKYAF